MALNFTSEQLHDEAERLGLAGPDDPLAPSVRSKAAASLAAQLRGATAAARGPQIAKVITVRPGRGPLVDGKPFPWVITDDPVGVEVRADGSGFVRLTIPAELVRIDSDTTSPDESEPRA